MWCAFVVNRGLTTRLWSINTERERDKEKEWEQTECRFHTSSIIIISMPYSHITFLEEFAGPRIEHFFTTAYSSEEKGIVERANQEGLRHLRALLFDSCVHDKWSIEQRIMNTVEKTSTFLEAHIMTIQCHGNLVGFFSDPVCRSGQKYIN